MKKKIELQGGVFDGISSVFAKKGGWDFTAGSGSTSVDTLTISTSATDIYEFPISDESGFNFDTGAPSMSTFKIKGLGTSWCSTFTPGDGTITLEIPCNDTDIMEVCGFPKNANPVSITLPKAVVGGSENTVTYKGAGFGAPQKVVVLGLMILNDTEDKLLYIKKSEFMAQLMFDASNKPVCVVLTGNIKNGGDASAFGVLDKQNA